VNDRFGRPVKGLRISVTEKCNFDCFYCHREGCPQARSEMTAGEIGEIVKLAAEIGVDKLKITGGEPLLRRDIADVISAVSVPGIKEVSMTTNGALLAERAHELAEAGLNRVNVSLDTLDPKKFERITGSRSLDAVLSGVDAAVDAGLGPVKLNMVVLAGLNDGEFRGMLDYASGKGAIVQFIELVDGGKNMKYHSRLDGIQAELEKIAVSTKTRWDMHARRRYTLPGGEAELVCPMHNSEFCFHCTRLRLTPDGRLKPCLLRNDNLVDVISPIRDGDMQLARQRFLDAISKREPYFRTNPK